MQHDIDPDELGRVLANTAMSHAVRALELRDNGAAPALLTAHTEASAKELITPLQVLANLVGAKASDTPPDWRKAGEENDRVVALCVAATRISTATGHLHHTDARGPVSDLLDYALPALVWLVTPDDPSGLG